MATISIDYDSKGDIELILEKKDHSLADEGSEGTQPISKSSEQDEHMKYEMGPLAIGVREFRLRVSSLKLVSSSRYFQTMLEGSRFPEGRELQEHGYVPVELLDPEDDPTAMMIILGILYDTKIRNKVNLPMLEKIAILVDKYQWHELMTPHATSWFDELVESEGLPDAFDRTLLIWLFIAWQFGIKDHFKALCGVAQQDTRNSIDLKDESIQLPTRVLKAINEQREVAFQKIEEAVKKFSTDLLDKEQQETQTSPQQKMLRCMVLGFSVFTSQELELADFAAPDHAGNSIRLLKDRMQLLSTQVDFKVYAPDGNHRYIIPKGDWDLKHTLEKAIDNLKMNEWDLEYDEFKKSPIIDQVRMDLEHQKKTLDSIVSVSEVSAESV